MPKHVRLSSSEYRAWRDNTAQWVSPEGLVIRAVTPEEEEAIFPALQTVKRTGKSCLVNLKASYAQTADATQRETIEFQAYFQVTRTGRESTAFLISIYVAKNRYVTGREVLRAQMLSRHGECFLLSANGKRLAMVRDPRIHRPTFKESQRTVPRPEQCACKTYFGTEPGRHHHICEFNSRAPLSERSTSETPRRSIQTNMFSREQLNALAFEAPGQSQQASGLPQAPNERRFLPQPGTQPTVQIEPSEEKLLPQKVEGSSSSDATSQAGKIVYSPDTCPHDCIGRRCGIAWPAPTGREMVEGQHHPLCEFAEGWRSKSREGTRMMLFDLQSHRPIREASPAECAKAGVAEKNTGLPTIEVAGAFYAVLLEGSPIPTRKAEPSSRLQGSQVASLRHTEPDVMRDIGASTAQEKLAEKLHEAQRAQRQANIERARQQASGLPSTPARSSDDPVEPFQGQSLPIDAVESTADPGAAL